MVVVGGPVVVVGGAVVGPFVVVVVAGGRVDDPGFASGGANGHSPNVLKTTSSNATYPFPLDPRSTEN